MPVITAATLGTSLYPEIVEEITRADASITSAAINAAIHEAKMYLSRYDLVQLFGTDTEEPTFTDHYLAALVKDLACWHLLRLCNSGVDMQVFRNAYLDAVSVLKSIMTGQLSPAGWPYAAGSATPPDGSAISWSANDRRNNYY